MTDLHPMNEALFENIKHINEYGQEYWSARELMPVLQYVEWRKFSGVIDKAKESCASSNNAQYPIILLTPTK